MTSSADVEIGDDIWITDHQHPYYGKAGKVITVGEEVIGVRLNGSTSPVGIHLKVGQFVKVTFHKNWHENEPAVRVDPDYQLPFLPPAHFAQAPFQLSDSAIEWADGQRAARIDNLKKTVTFLQQEIQRLETNSVTFKVEHNAPRREYSWSGPALDPEVEKARLRLTDQVWLDTDQHTVLAAALKWLQNKEMVDSKIRGARITDGYPWEVTVKHRDGKEEMILFPLLEQREEVIKIIDFMEDGQKN